MIRESSVELLPYTRVTHLIAERMYIFIYKYIFVLYTLQIYKYTSMFSLSAHEPIPYSLVNVHTYVCTLTIYFGAWCTYNNLRES